MNEKNLPTLDFAALSAMGEEERTAALADGRTETACLFGKGETLAVSADEEIGALYLVWHDRPQPWTLEIGGERVSCGRVRMSHRGEV